MKIKSYLSNLVQHLGLSEEDFSIEVEENDPDSVGAGEVNVQLNIPDDDVGLFVGYKAEVINSIQRILRIIFAKDYEEKRISLNINNYRQDRLTQIKDKLRDITSRLEEDNDEYIFPYISSFERFNIHSLISDDSEFSEFESFSEGEGSGRRLVVRKKAQV